MKASATATIAGQRNRGSIAGFSWHHCGENRFVVPLLTTTNEPVKRCRLPAKRDHHTNETDTGKKGYSEIGLVKFSTAQSGGSHKMTGSSHRFFRLQFIASPFSSRPARCPSETSHEATRLRAGSYLRGDHSARSIH